MKRKREKKPSPKTHSFDVHRIKFTAIHFVSDIGRWNRLIFVILRCDMISSHIYFPKNLKLCAVLSATHTHIHARSISIRSNCIFLRNILIVCIIFRLKAIWCVEAGEGEGRGLEWFSSDRKFNYAERCWLNRKWDCWWLFGLLGCAEEVKLVRSWRWRRALDPEGNCAFHLSSISQQSNHQLRNGNNTSSAALIKMSQISKWSAVRINHASSATPVMREMKIVMKMIGILAEQKWSNLPSDNSTTKKIDVKRETT